MKLSFVTEWIRESCSSRARQAHCTSILPLEELKPTTACLSFCFCAPFWPVSLQYICKANLALIWRAAAPNLIAKAACLNIIHCCTDARLLRGVTVTLLCGRTELPARLPVFPAKLGAGGEMPMLAMSNHCYKHQKHQKQTYRISCLSAPGPSHSAPAVPLAGSGSWQAHSLSRQSAGGTAPCWWTSSESWWSSWAASLSDGARRKGHSSLLREALDTAAASSAQKSTEKVHARPDGHMPDSLLNAILSGEATSQTSKSFNLEPTTITKSKQEILQRFSRFSHRQAATRKKEVKNKEPQENGRE